ncbi:ATP-binding protein [Streptomyces sp. NPDC020571]|uniref:ATP-binding protein n=1 Tax=Streptomyces sp. NPDC020571 TaxID=3365079 RepID=UPI003792DBBF
MTFRPSISKSFSFRVPPDVGAVSSARRRVVAIVHDWDVPLGEDTVETLELLASEVVANAVVHTRAGCQVTVSWDGTRVRLEVKDAEGGLLPRRPSVGTYEENGRGLQLVDGLAQRWGSRLTPDGKVVWFEIGSCSPLTLRPCPTASDIDPPLREHNGRRWLPNQVAVRSAAFAHLPLPPDH